MENFLQAQQQRLTNEGLMGLQAESGLERNQRELEAIMARARATQAEPSFTLTEQIEMVLLAQDIAEDEGSDWEDCEVLAGLVEQREAEIRSGVERGAIPCRVLSAESALKTIWRHQLWVKGLSPDELGELRERFPEI